MIILRKSILAHSQSHAAANSELYLAEVKADFIASISTEVLRRCEHLPGVTKVLTMSIYTGEIDTLLKRVCASLYRRYVEEKEGDIEVIIARRNFEKLDISQAKFISHTISLAELVFKDSLAIRPFIYGRSVYLRLALAQ